MPPVYDAQTGLTCSSCAGRAPLPIVRSFFSQSEDGLDITVLYRVATRREFNGGPEELRIPKQSRTPQMCRCASRAIPAHTAWRKAGGRTRIHGEISDTTVHASSILVAIALERVSTRSSARRDRSMLLDVLGREFKHSETDQGGRLLPSTGSAIPEVQRGSVPDSGLGYRLPTSARSPRAGEW